MQMSRADLAEFHIHCIAPLSIWHTIKAVGHTDSLDYAIRRCKELAEKEKSKDYLLIFRVVQTRGEVLFISHVQFDIVTHYDMRDKLKPIIEETMLESAE